MGIKAVTCITTGQGETGRGEGQKKGGRQKHLGQDERREEMEEMKQKEKTLLKEAFESLDICH